LAAPIEMFSERRPGRLVIFARSRKLITLAPGAPAVHCGFDSMEATDPTAGVQ
jgi:hypothetical protein